MIKQYKAYNRVFSVSACTKEDIPSHMQRVSSFWEANKLKEIEEILLNPEETNLKFKITDDKGKLHFFLYGKELDIGLAWLTVFYVSSRTVSAIAAHYCFNKLGLYRGQFLPPKPVKKSRIIPYSKWVLEHSIRFHHSANTPLEIDMFSKHLNNYWQDMFDKKIIQAL